MSHLKLVERPNATPADTDVGSTDLMTGRTYLIEGAADRALPRGAVGGYWITAEGSEIVPPRIDAEGRAAICFWDTDVALSALADRALYDLSGNRLSPGPIQSNSLLLESSELEGPALDEQLELWMAPRFELQFSTHCDAARLGVVTLVESQRFIDLEEGGQIRLLDTGTGSDEEAEPVLYLDPQSPCVVVPVGDPQPIATNQRYSVSTRVGQQIVDTWEGQSVVSVTVLEQYFSYFMQQLADENGEPLCWLPIHPPIVWGWSIRVGRRVDNHWDILRRKVMRPTVGHEGLYLPRWTTNTLALQGM